MGRNQSAAAMIQLMVKHQSGQSIISTLTLSSNLDELLFELSKCTQISASSIKVKRGLTPTALNVCDRAVTLDQSGFQRRETLWIEELFCLPII